MESLRGRLLWRSAILVAVVAASVALSRTGWIGNYHLYLANLTLVNAIAAIGLVVISGVAGQMSLGTAGLMAVGAYATGILVTKLGLGFGAALVLGPLAAALVGTLLAAPALRLTGLHLAIVTLTFGVIVIQVIGKGGSWTGGMSGLNLPPLRLFGIPLTAERDRFALILVLAALTAYVSSNLLSFKVGRALFAMREREAMARSMGVDIGAYKSLAFAYGSLLAGLSGTLYASLKGFISVEDFSTNSALYFFVMIAVGGMTSIWGGLIGAVFVTLLPELLTDFKEAADAVFGATLTAVVAIMPGGLISLGAKWRKARVRRLQRDGGA